MADATRKLEVLVVGDSSSLQRAFGQGSRSAKRFERDAGGASRAAIPLSKGADRIRSSFGGAATSAVRFAAAGAGVASVGLAVRKVGTETIGFDRSMRNVNSIAQLNERQFQNLGKEVLELAGPTAQAPQTLSDGLYDLVSSGFKGRNALMVLRASARAATAGLTTTETSAAAVAAVLNAYRRPAKDAGDVSDALFRTVDRGVLSFEALAQNVGDVLPFASQLKIPIQDVGAAIATMTKQGIQAPETMTRIKQAMLAFIKPGKGMQAALEEIGVESGEALIKQKGFQGALEAVVGTTDGSKAAIAKLFPEVRGLGGALALTGGNARAAREDLQTLGDRSGATTRALAQQSQSVAFQWNRLKALASVLSIGVGSELIPEFKELIDVASRVTEVFSREDLTFEEKFARSRDIAKPLADSLVQGIEEAVPEVASHAGQLGVKAAGALLHGFVEADFWGKAVLALFIAAKVRKFQLAFGALGSQSGLAWATGFRSTAQAASVPIVAPTTVAPVPVPSRRPRSGGAATGIGHDIAVLGGGVAAGGAAGGVLGGLRGQLVRLRPGLVAIGKTTLWGAVLIGGLDAVMQEGGVERKLQAFLSSVTLGAVPPPEKAGFGEALRQLSQKALGGEWGGSGKQDQRGAISNAVRDLNRNLSNPAVVRRYTTELSTLAREYGITGRAVGVFRREVNQTFRSLGAARGFQVGAAIARDGDVAHIEIRRMKRTLEELPPAARKSARDAMTGFLVNMVQRGELSVAEFRRIMRRLNRAADTGGTNLTRSLATSMHSVGNVVAAGAGNIFPPLNAALAALGVKPVKISAEKFAIGGLDLAVKGVQYLTGAAKKAMGGLVDTPIVMMGEEAPRHPEWVIATNPAYRQANISYWAQAGHDLGVPGFRTGGRRGSSTAATRFVDPVHPSQGPLESDPIVGAERYATGGRRGRSPHVKAPPVHGPSGALTSLARGALGKVEDAANRRLRQAFRQSDRADQGGGDRGGRGPGRWEGGNTLDFGQALARKFGLRISSTFRSIAHNRAVGGVEGSKHTHGSPTNPGAIDFTPPSQAAAAYARRQGVSEVLIHDAGSGLHLHLGFFRRGGLLKFAKGGRRASREARSSQTKRVPGLDKADTYGEVSSAIRNRMRDVWFFAAPHFRAAGEPMPRVRFPKHSKSYAWFNPKKNDVAFGPSARRQFAQGDDYAEATLLHEWAHVFQKPSLRTWEAEGGAESFASLVSPRVYRALRIPFKQPQLAYPKFVRRVREQKDRKWIMGGQFGFARGGRFAAKGRRPRGTYPRGTAIAAAYQADAPTTVGDVATNRIPVVGEPWTPRGQSRRAGSRIGGLGRRMRRFAKGGKFVATAYGPPWGGIQGTGTTKGGTNLKSGPKRYIVAVDPNVIPLGSKLKIRPNPFGYGGTFLADDIGGEIDGNRIDFYDWRGRAAQEKWGVRSVNVEVVGGPGTGGGSRGGTGGGRKTKPPKTYKLGQFKDSGARSTLPPMPKLTGGTDFQIGQLQSYRERAEGGFDTGDEGAHYERVKRLASRRTAVGKDERDRILEARKELRELNRERARSKALGDIDLKIKGLEALKEAGDTLRDMVDRAGDLFSKRREKEIEEGPLGAELAGIRIRQRDTERAKEDAQLQKDLERARLTKDPRKIKEAEDAIAAVQLERRAQFLEEQIELQRAGVEAETEEFKKGLEKQLGQWTAFLGQRLVTATRFATEINKILVPLGLEAFELTPDIASAFGGPPAPGGGPGGGGGAAKGPNYGATPFKNENQYLDWQRQPDHIKDRWSRYHGEFPNRTWSDFKAAGYPTLAEAKKTRRASGGTVGGIGELVRISELGPETLYLPGGTQVVPASQSGRREAPVIEHLEVHHNSSGGDESLASAIVWQLVARGLIKR